MLAALAACAAAGAARAAPPEAGADLPALIDAAAIRFDLPPRLITGVMRRESAFQPKAVSSAGALGLMQIMPKTYGELQARYGLGADPLHPRDNILAGAAYLRELYDRFGAHGFLAAYNAGPARYMRSLLDGRPLPSETVAYVRRLDADLSLTPLTGPIQPAAPSVFVSLSAGQKSTTVGLSPVAGAALFASVGEARDGR